MNITEQAANELKMVLDEFNKPGAGIHVFSTQGCCGPSIQMDVATHIGNGETVISLEGIDFFVSNDLLTKLADVTIEYRSNTFRLAGLQKTSSGCC
ncbi:MAG: hypothetical protein NTZ69_08200 [Bacteroidia bacterium]|nr:hypothetical protein [Bacteroidia bacterium]